MVVAQGRNGALFEGRLQNVDEARIAERPIDCRPIELAHWFSPRLI